MATLSPEIASSAGGLALAKPQVSAPSSPSRSLSPAIDVTPLILRVNVICGRDLAPKDRNGTSDPYLVLTLGEAREATSTVSKTLNPYWNQVVDFPILGPQSRVLEAVCWDKDRFGKDYMGEFDLNLENLIALNDKLEELMKIPLISRRPGKKDSNVTGHIELKCQLVEPGNPIATKCHMFTKLKSLLTAAPIEPLIDRSDSDIESDGKQTPTSSKLSLLIPRLRTKSKPPSAYALSSDMDLNHGVLFLEIIRINDLPPEKNVTRTGFDMDPFVVISLGKKTYRTKVIRHDLNPIFNEQFYFTVPKNEKNFSLSFEVIDKDKMSNNDYVGNASLPLTTLISLGSKPNPITGLYPVSENETAPVPSHGLAPETKKSRFWGLSRSSSAQSLPKVNMPPVGALGHQVSPKLGPVASSLYTTTVAVVTPSQNTDTSPNVELITEDRPPEYSQDNSDPNVFVLPLKLKNSSRWENKHNPVLYVRAKYIPLPSLRQQLWRALLKLYDADGNERIDHVELTTMLDTLGSTLYDTTVQGFFDRFAAENGGDNSYLSFDQAIQCLEDKIDHSPVEPESLANRIRNLEVSSSTPDDGGSSCPSGVASLHNSPTEQSLAELASDDVSDSSPGHTQESPPNQRVEHVIEIRECPICHQPRMNHRSESDILVHIAICANQDWQQLNNMVFSSYVTSSQAQRKWFSKVLNKVSYGRYQVGANSANILVQDRLTGKIIEELMGTYVRLCIRILYKGTKNREMEAKSVRKLLKHLTIKQGKKFDDPASINEINAFIQFHGLDMSDVLLPTSEFKSFNEFFYRAMKPTARPCCEPNRPEIVTSAADCRMVVFDSIDKAQKIWVKGREFTMSRLFGDAYPEDAHRYVNGSMAIFRLAPQDYHRFHIPVDGVMGEPKRIEGEYYTVNPMAIRSALDVYGENIRVLVPIDSVAHGRVMVVCVGAMMVGSTVITATPGSTVKRGDELGYFKFGGSTLLLFFESGKVKWDLDLSENSEKPLETLVRVGMSVGTKPGTEHAKSVHTQDLAT